MFCDLLTFFLFHHLLFLQPLREELARFFFSQVVSAVDFCHTRGVVHRDLKLDNVLLDNQGNVKVTDFGHAGIFQKGWDIFQTQLVGGLSHIAPEQVCRRRRIRGRGRRRGRGRGKG